MLYSGRVVPCSFHLDSRLNPISAYRPYLVKQILFHSELGLISKSVTHAGASPDCMTVIHSHGWKLLVFHREMVTLIGELSNPWIVSLIYELLALLLDRRIVTFIGQPLAHGSIKIQNRCLTSLDFSSFALVLAFNIPNFGPPIFLLSSGGVSELPRLSSSTFGVPISSLCHLFPFFAFYHSTLKNSLSKISLFFESLSVGNSPSLRTRCRPIHQPPQQHVYGALSNKMLYPVSGWAIAAQKDSIVSRKSRERAEIVL